MRRSAPRRAYLHAFAALAIPCALAVITAPALAESTRTLRLEHAAAAPFAVENLAGTMRVTAGATDKVIAVATIHAEDDATAGLIRFEQVTDEKGIQTLRVIYPTDKYSSFRYPGGDEHADHWLARWFGMGSSTTTKYAGQRVSVKSSSGVLLYADVEVQVPRRAVEGTFRNLVGPIYGEGVEGTLTFDGASSDVTLGSLKGNITADTGSGDVKASGIEGAFTCDTGSGDCNLSDFRGDLVKCDVGSGDVNVSNGTAKRVEADTGSGDVDVRDFDLEEFDADTGSGDVLLESRGGRLATVKADTGSGNVTLQLDPSAGFEARSSHGSGELVSRFSDAEPIVKDREVVGYRRGDGRTRIDVATGSGDCVLEPRS